MTIDELCAKCKYLREEEFEILMHELRQEEKRRENRERNEDWQTVCQVIDMFTHKWGCLCVSDKTEFCNDINLRFGEYAFSEFGVIEVGA